MPLPIWAGAALTGLLGAAGTVYTNWQHRKEARRQEQFQERMSGSAAQRSVQDYRRAGLNPALAYDRSASTPSGAAATIGDVGAAGIASAQNARMVKAQLDNMYETQKLTRAQTQVNQIEAANKLVEGEQMRQSLLFQGQNQPHDLRRRAHEATIAGLLVPGHRGTASMEEWLQSMAPGLGSGSLRLMLELFKNFKPGR